MKGSDLRLLIEGSEVPIKDILQISKMAKSTLYSLYEKEKVKPSKVRVIQEAIKVYKSSLSLELQKPEKSYMSKEGEEYEYNFENERALWKTLVEELRSHNQLLKEEKTRLEKELSTCLSQISAYESKQQSKKSGKNP